MSYAVFGRAVGDLLAVSRAITRAGKVWCGRGLRAGYWQMMRTGAFALVLAAAMLAPMAAQAIEPDEILTDPVLEERARGLTKQLRCVVCQNQSLDDSDAPLAKDMRVLVRERLQEGDSDGEVLDYLVARYGEFVLLQPRFGMHTLILWAAPIALMLFVIAMAVWRFRAHAQQRSSERLDPDEEARLAAALQRLDDTSTS
ncbi:MAG: cytochrome c-type biogenesis protein [Pseudomonadota bacterium]